MPAGHAAGKVAGTATQYQHVDLYRKLILRRQLLRHAAAGPAYCPFIGDGDIAAQLYRDRDVYGADLDPARVATAAGRLTGRIIVADCDTWPFPDVNGLPFAVADFDAYADPYASFRAFWAAAEKADRLVVFFTDGQRMAALRGLPYRTPDGERKYGATTTERRQVSLGYLPRMYQWLAGAVRPRRVVFKTGYLRVKMTYWGAIIDV